MASSAQRNHHALAAMYETAASKLEETDLRAFILHQSAWLRVRNSPTAYVERARRVLNQLLRP